MSRFIQASFLVAALLLVLPSKSVGLVVPRSPATSSSSPRRTSCFYLNANEIRGGGGDPANDDASPSTSSIAPISKMTSSISDGFQKRVAADPNFLVKSCLEVVLAAGTQFAAELSRRGAAGCLTEIDFVVAGVLTAICGKYYSAWTVAPTASSSSEGDGNDTVDEAAAAAETNGTGFWSTVPTNAFQPYHLDGKTLTLMERLAALVKPIPSLFRAGVIASAIGYGFTSLLVSLRALLVPTYVARTVNINIIHACVYTGAFMSFVSNIRYQLLSGIVEPRLIDRYFHKFPTLQATLTFGVRLANGLLGSMIAIAGMKYFGLQKVKG